MQKYIVMITILLISVGIACAQGRTVVTQTTIKEKIGTQTFKQVIVSGAQQDDVYTINTVPVLRDEYMKKYLQAHEQELVKQYEQAEELERKNIVFQETIQKAAYSKLGLQILKNIQQIIEKLEHAHIQNFYVYTKKTFVSFVQLEEALQFVMQAQQHLDESTDLDSLQKVVTCLEQYLPLFQSLYQESVAYAVQACDDTAQLKKLLQLV